MTTQSGISVSSSLYERFTTLQNDVSSRALFIHIQNESLQAGQTLPVQGDVLQDFDSLRAEVEDTTPAYILYRLERDWLLVVYVPDTAPVRAKMLYASTRATLSKQLGESNFVDSLFATSKDDLTTEALKAHRRAGAEAPLTEREKEAKQVAEAERDTRGTSRSNNLAGAKGIAWSDEAREAVKDLSEKKGMLSLNIDITTETLQVLFRSDNLALPQEIAYTLYYHSGTDQFVCIYCCPSSSPIKSRMVYSSSIASIINTANDYGLSIAKRMETSDPNEVNEQYISKELGGTMETTPPVSGFSKPKRPGRK